MTIRRMVAVLAATMALAGASADVPRYPPRTILLFVASWCAPCHAELGRLESIDRAAGPYRLRVVPFDTSRATLAMLARVPPGQRWSPDPARAAAVRADLFGASAALPYSVAIGGDGRPCASLRGGLDAGRAAALVARCGAP